MIPIDFEREHFLNALAYKVQNPNRKINHAILIGGHPGSGKDTMLAPFFWAIGGESKLNCSLVRNEDLNSQWGYALECEVMEIAELRQSEAKDRRALENALKPYHGAIIYISHDSYFARNIGGAELEISPSKQA